MAITGSRGERKSTFEAARNLGWSIGGTRWGGGPPLSIFAGSTCEGGWPAAGDVGERCPPDPHAVRTNPTAAKKAAARALLILLLPGSAPPRPSARRPVRGDEPAARLDA